MQWLIDIIKEWVIAQAYATVAWVQAQGYLTAGFVDRGDPAAFDFDKTDLITDGTWHDLDLSTIVPAGAKAILASILINDELIERSLMFRKKGNVNIFNRSLIYTQVSNIYNSLDLVIPVDADRKIQYRGEAIVWVAIYVTVKGWWF